MSRLSSIVTAKLKYQAELLTGTGTWTRPARIYLNEVSVTMIGGGGGGSNEATDSVLPASGGQVVIQENVVAGATENYSCGAGGTGASGSSNAAGGDGVNTAFAALTALGGPGAPLKASGGFANYVGAMGGLNGDQTSDNRAMMSQGQSQRRGGPGGGWLNNVNSALGQGAGGGGLILDATMPGSAGVGASSGGMGYGAAGASAMDAQAGTDGAPGAILLEWLEYV